MDLDTLKTTVIGGSGITFQFIEVIPEAVRVSVGIVTIAYFLYKIALIRKQLKE